MSKVLDEAGGISNGLWRYRYIPVVLVVLVGVVCSVLLFGAVRRWEWGRMQRDFEQAAKERIKKITKLYGGRIWVESEVGEGSTFFFTLPRQELGITSDAKLEAGIVG